MKVKSKLIVCPKTVRQVGTTTHCIVCDKADSCRAVKEYLISEDGEIG